MKFIFWYLGVALVLSCQSPTQNFQDISPNKLFTLLPSQRTQIDFINNLDTNILAKNLPITYFLQGAGVAVGDINNDGLADIYMVSNQNPNQLYLNLGNFQFKNITLQAKVQGKDTWATGAYFIDINGDGLLDIYVCYADEKNAHNQLFLHQGFDHSGIPIFAEKAQNYGIDNAGYSKQALFFDYDHDGDLDLYLLNETRGRVQDLPCAFYENQQGNFIEISQKIRLPKHFATSATIADFNQDNFMDIYINMSSPKSDKIFFGNQQKVFQQGNEKLPYSQNFTHKNIFVADINNDALPDLFISEKNNFYPKNDHKRYPKSILYLNENPNLKDVSYFSKIANTNFAAHHLIADLNNDGYKDILMSNGTWQNFFENIGLLKKYYFNELFKKILTQKSTNQVFANYLGLNFVDKTKDWGFNFPSFSSGMAYADLDNDGDLDLIINNFNQPAFIYRNESNKLTKHNYLKIRLIGKDLNTSGIGAKVVIKTKDKVFFQEQSPNKMPLSSVEHVLNFGLGEYDFLDTVAVFWTNGQSQVLTQLKANQFITFEQKNAIANDLAWIEEKKENTIFQKIELNIGLNIPKKIEQKQVIPDFTLPQSKAFLAIGDVDANGLEDFFVGSPFSNVPSLLFLQQKDGFFVESKQKAFEKDRIFEEKDAVFFDADQDGDLDLFVTGFSQENPNQNRLYFNDSKGNFSRNNEIIGYPQQSFAIRVADIDQDQDMDLLLLGNSPNRKSSLIQLLYNDGKANFDEKTYINSKLQIWNDAIFADIDQDQDQDLILVGNGTEICFFENNESVFSDITEKLDIEKMQGLWQSIYASDWDGDKDLDFIVGNLGENSLVKATPKHSAKAFWEESQEGKQLFMRIFEQDKPVFLRLDSVSNSFVRDSLEISSENKAIWELTHLKSVLLENKNGTFQPKFLPQEAQLMPISKVLAHDFDHDGHTDLILVGSYEKFRWQAALTQNCIFLRGTKNGFQYLPKKQLGIPSEWFIQDMKLLKNNLLLLLLEDGSIQILSFYPTKAQ